MNHQTASLTYLMLTNLGIALSVVFGLVPMQYASAEEDDSSTETESEDEINCVISGWDNTQNCKGISAVDEENEENTEMAQEIPFILPLAL